MQYEKEFLRKLYRNLLDMRLLEQKMVDTYAQGRVPGHIHSGVGQEASFVGVLANYKEGDYYKRTHRLTAVPYMMGTSLDTFFGELLAKTTPAAGAAPSTSASCTPAIWAFPAHWAATPPWALARR